MNKLTSGLASVALIATSFTPLALVPIAPALAASPAQEECEDELGGFYEKSGGQITCTIVSTETTGAGGHGQPITSTTLYWTNGTWNNEPQADSDSNCSGPGKSADKSNHC